MDPRFFLDWYWRIVGRLGLSEACLAKGELTLAAEQSDLALDSALSTPDPALKALAWTMKARIAMAGQDWQQAEQCLKSAFAALAAGNVPSAAWRVHAAAAELHRRNGNKTLERQSRSDAAETLRLLAYSFREGADLRETLLAAAHANE
jgi:hypothetical protein